MKNLTQGKPWKVLMSFAIPLILSGLIQQFYNLADSIIVGNFAGASGVISGEDALAAVGASSTITLLFIMLGNGGSMGCGVVISQMFGGRRFAELKTTLYTSLIFFGAVALLMMVVGSIIAAPLTSIMNTPPEIFDAAVDYLRIYMFGLPFLFIYNVCNAIFNAMGDSKKPLYFLIFSTIFNIVLDYIFVAKFGWAVKGVAWATFIAQGCAGILSLVTLLKKTAAIETGDAHIRLFDTGKLKSMLRIGVPSMLQMSIVSVGSLLVQAIVNGFGPAFIAGYSAASRIHHFLSTIVNTSGSAVSTYTAQNIGAGRIDRVNDGIKATLTFTLSATVILTGVVFCFGENLVRLFADAPSAEALQAGVYYLRLIIIGLFAFSVFNCLNGVARGAGYMPAFTISTFADLGVRVIFAYAFVKVFDRNVIAISVLVGWIAGMLIAVGFHLTGKWKHAKKV